MRNKTSTADFIVVINVSTVTMLPTGKLFILQFGKKPKPKPDRQHFPLV